MSKWTYRNEYVRCGKPACRSCPHGPYWYRYQRRGEKVKKEYVGKIKPEDLGGELHREDGRVWDVYDDMLAAGGRNRTNAEAVLGLPERYRHGDLLAAYRRGCMIHHPDRGGDTRKMQAINAAWDYLRTYHRWK